MTLHSSRPDARTDLLHGTLDMLILRTLQWGPQHGYAIGQTIRAQSGDVLQVEAGSLYPALQRLAKRGWVTSKWGQTARTSARSSIGLRRKARNSCCGKHRGGPSWSPPSAT
jgi:DNA-binding PadR family transcriptional regulator